MSEQGLSHSRIFIYHNLYVCRYSMVYEELSHPLSYVTLIKTVKSIQDYIIWYFKE